jgi:hypothetical protein
MSSLVSHAERIWDELLELDPQLRRGARLGVAALAGFAFAIALVAGARTPQTTVRVLPHARVADTTGASAPASRFEPIRTLGDLLPARRVAPPPAPSPSPARTATEPPATVATTPVPTFTSPPPAPPVAQPVQPRIVPRQPAPVAPRPAKPAPAPQTFDSSG